MLEYPADGLKKCGSKNFEHGKNVIGEVWGECTILDIAGQNDYCDLYVWVQCSCGSIFPTRYRNLSTGKTTKCRGHLKNGGVVGKTFNRITVLEQLENDSNNHIMVKCRCHCGEIFECRYNNLATGNTKSCGCTKSYGEEICVNLLKTLNIDFIREKTYPDLKDKLNLRFDFYLPQYNVLIEIDGSFHREDKGRYGIEYTKKHDIIKTQYAQKNKIVLKRFIYNDTKNNGLIDLEREIKKFLLELKSS